MTDRLFTEDTLVIATHNAGKMREIKALFGGFGINILSAADLGLDEPDETETSFTDNALLKARAAAMRAGQPALADDSGLCVNALDGAPGIYSARWAGPDRDFSLAMTAVETALTNTGNSDQGAEFFCALALVWPDGDEVCVEGRVKGQITFPPRGIHGFGYDPIFQPDGHQISFGEMDPDAKHAMSHRADAFAQLLARCFGKADGI
jgi:XTP/dITP diphosphohydrolase